MQSPVKNLWLQPRWIIPAMCLAAAGLFTNMTQTSSAYLVDTSKRIVTVAPGASDDASADLHKALQFLADRKNPALTWTVRFKPGTYKLSRSVVIDKLRNVSLVSDPKKPAVLKKTSNFQGEYLLGFRFARSIRLSGLHFHGNTAGKGPAWSDQGLYLGSSHGVTVRNNTFRNFGNAALRITTSESDRKPGINSSNSVVAGNVFKNIFQISTTSNDELHGATSQYLFQNNVIDGLNGSIKFASRTPGARNVKVIGNTIRNGGNHGIEVNNYSDVIISRNKLSNIKNAAITAYTNPRASSAFPWGDNFMITGNRIENVGRAIRFSPNPYKNGTPVQPRNVVIDGNTIVNVGPEAPAIAIVNGSVRNLKITNNKLSKIKHKKPVSVGDKAVPGIYLNNYSQQ